MENRDLILEISTKILGAAVLSSRGRADSWDDICADAGYDECNRRGNPGLYQRAHNEACRSQGHTGMVKKVDAPIDEGDVSTMAAEGANLGQHHLLAQNESKTLCGDSQMHKKVKRANLRPETLCTSCVKNEDHRLQELRSQNLPDWQREAYERQGYF